MNQNRRAILLSSMVALVAPVALAQDDASRYPTKPIRLILPNAPGGVSDQTARNLQPVMQSLLGQPIVIESKPGASGNIAMELTARAPADGHTLFLSTVVVAINPSIFKNMKLRPDQDLSGVSLVVMTPTVLVAHPDFAPNSVREVVALAKGKPKQISFASSGSGSVTRMEMEKFSHEAGIDLMHVPYKAGAGAAINDVLAGHVQMTLTTLTPVLPLIKAGKLKALAVTSLKRQALLPDVPSFSEQGYLKEGSQQWQALFAPAGTPSAVVAKIHAAVTAALADPKVQKNMAEAGQTPAPSMSPTEVDEFIRNEMKTWGALVDRLGVTND